MDLKKINSLIADDYTNNNHPVSTLSDAAQHLAGKPLFYNLDCSQAYHCLQMVDQRSVEMLAFIFANRTFAFEGLAQGLSRRVSVFFKFNAWVLGPSCRSWPICSILGRDWHRSQQCYRPYPEQSSSLQVHSSSRIETDNQEVPFRSRTSWKTKKNNFARRNLAASSKNSQFPRYT